MLTALVTMTLGLVLLLAGPAAAENPVLDAEGDADVASALAEARQVQGVCYGYVLSVSDGDTGQFSGTYFVSGAGIEVRPTDCPEGRVFLQADIVYTSSFSEAEDSASWFVDSTLPGVGIEDVEALGLSAGDLLDDSKSETTLLNAVLSLPGIATEEAGVEPLVLDPNTAPLPEDARATNTPGSDWLRQNSTLLVLCVLLVLGGAAMFVLSLSRVRRRISSGVSSRLSAVQPDEPVAAHPTNPWSPS